MVIAILQDAITPCEQPSDLPNLSMAYDQKAANVWTARIIPLILTGILGYSSWVVVGPLCGREIAAAVMLTVLTLSTVDYLLKPSTSASSIRPGAAIAILVVYFLLLLLLAVSYSRLLYTVLVHPGYTPRGPQYYANKKRRAKRRHTRGSSNTLAS